MLALRMAGCSEFGLSTGNKPPAQAWQLLTCAVEPDIRSAAHHSADC